jgi:hypothetical protein
MLHDSITFATEPTALEEAQMKRATLSFSLTLLLIALGYFILQNPHPSRAQSSQDGSQDCCGPTHPVLPRELDFPYYSLQNGFGSTLNLVSDSPAPLDFTLSVHARSGQTLVAPKITIQPQAKLPVDMAALLKSLGADVTGDFSEGSVSLNFVGTIMPLVGQMTITNPALRLVHDSEMVENDPGRTDIPAVLDGLWWNISGGRDAQFMVTNMSALRASADVFLDFSGTRHPSVELDFRPHETKTVSITQLLSGLNASPATASEGGITIIQREFQPTLIAQGKVLDPASGFSTTLSFPDPARERANSLHASGLPIGKPTPDSPFARTGYFVPRVVLRNLTGAPQTVTITFEYPKGSTWNSAEAPGGSAIPKVHAVAAVSSPTTNKTNQNSRGGAAATISPADLTDQFTLAPLSVGPYSTADFSLDAVMGQLPLPVPYCSIRIQYSGAPGSAIAQVSSVDVRREMVIDAPIANEGDGWHGSGANPWHLDKETESILFLTDEGDKPARIGFSVTAGDVHYQLTTLKLAPHETRAIDMRKLRDAQQPDYQRNKIPADASDGSVYWTRLDNTPVMGRLVVIQRHNGMASSYDCCPCRCPSNFTSTGVSTDPPNVPPIIPGQTCQHYATAAYRDCNFVYSYYDVTSSSTWLSSSTSVATVDGIGLVTGVSGGTPTISANYSDFTWNWSVVEGACVDTPRSHTGSASCPVVSASITVNLGPPPSSRSSSFSTGDNLSFAGFISCGNVLGAQGCSSGWFWQNEAVGTVSDDAGNWATTRDINGETLTIYHTDFTSTTTNFGYSHDNPATGLVQQATGTKNVFFIDAPGPYFSSNIADIDDQTTFTSRICSTKTSTAYCVCVDYNYHLVGYSNGIAAVVDTTNSSSAITKTSYSCQPQR